MKSTREPFLAVEIVEPTKEEVASYFKEGEIPPQRNSPDYPRTFKKCKILKTYDEFTFPKGSWWVIGESPGMKINYFGKPITLIQEKDIYGTATK